MKLYARILTLSLLFSLGTAQASPLALPVAHGEVIRDFARITFEWPDSVYFTATAEGNTVSVTFDRQANPDFGSLLQTLYPYVKHATLRPDGRTIVFTLNKPYRIRTFVSDNINGIDLLEVTSKSRKHAGEPRLKKTTVTEKAKTPPLEKPTMADVRLFAALAPAAGEPEKPMSTPETAPPPTSAPAESTPAPVEAETEEPAPQMVESAAPEAKPVEAEVPMPLTYSKKDEAPNEGFVKIGLSISEDNATLRFPFAERLAMAVFTRDKTLWVVINKPIQLDVSDFTETTSKLVGKPDIIPSAKSTILRVPIDEKLRPSTTKETDSYSWGILLAAQPQPLQEILPLALRMETTPPQLFIPALEMADSISVFDPLVGDELVIMPLFKPGTGIANAKDFVDFALLPSAQGIAVLKKSDQVSVDTLRDGVRVTAADGASFTPDLPMTEVKQGHEKLLDVGTLFPYLQWKTQDPNNSRPELQAFYKQIMHAPDVNKANEARLNIAKIYLGQGMAAEALGALDVIREKDPSFYRSHKLAALRGAANFLMYRYADASRDFAASELDKQKEPDFWRKVVADLLGNPDEEYDFLSLNEDYISKYPPEMRRRLVIVVADRAIFDKNYNEALKIIESLQEPELREPVQDYIRFLMASISAGTGQDAEAQEIWDELAENYTHPFIRASAELARVMWAIDHDELTAKKAEDRLERLRLSWHGDRMELQIIQLLGKLYEDKKDYINAMRIWHGGIVSFPNSALAVEMKEKMQNAFNIMFNQGKADELPSLDVLAMYYEYRNYAPSGTGSGDLIEKLADRLVSVDLLSQAADLIDSQMRYIAEKEQRSRLGAGLAAIHLHNNNPKKALEALQDSLYGENSLLLRLHRNRLAAEAMVAQDRLPSALELLGQDTSQEAEWIRLDIFWKQRNWDKVISTVEGLFKQRPDVTVALSLDESEALMKLALAYVFENNTIQVQYLRDYFLPLLADNPYKDAFNFVTQPDFAVTTTNFDEVIKNLSDTRNFIGHYNTRIKLADTPAVTPKDEKTKTQ